MSTNAGFFFGGGEGRYWLPEMDHWIELIAIMYFILKKKTLPNNLMVEFSCLCSKMFVNTTD